MKTTSLGTAIALHQFENFKSSALPSLQKEASEIRAATVISESLQEELGAFFIFQKIINNVVANYCLIW
jgi:hypothetical protein